MVLAAREVFGVAAFVQRDYGYIAVEVDRLGVGVEVVSSEDASRKNRFSGDRQRAHGVTDPRRNGLVLSQPVPLIDWRVLIRADFDVRQVVVFEIVGQ